jgi:hypothetical protein
MSGEPADLRDLASQLHSCLVAMGEAGIPSYVGMSITAPMLQNYI